MSTHACRRPSRNAGPRALLLAGLLGSTGLAHAQTNRKLSGPITTGPSQEGDVLGLALSPDGSRVVYVATQDARNVVELYGRPLDGSASPVKLSGALAPGGNVSGPLDPPSLSFQLGSDSRRVVYLADAHVDQLFELFSAPLDGSAPPAQLSGPMGPLGDVVAFRLAPDARRVVYLADPDVDGIYGLFSAPLDGSAAPLALGFSPLAATAAFEVSPDSRRVVAIGAGFDLECAPLDGSASPVALSGRPSPHREVVDFRISSDSRRVAYRELRELPDHLLPSLASELFSAPIDGSARAVPLTPSSSLARRHHVLAQEITADATTVVFSTPVGLFGVPIDGSAAPRSIGSGKIVTFELAPDSRRAVYVRDEGSYYDPRFALFSALVDGSKHPVQLDRGDRAHSDPSSFSITSDGQRVVYLADQDESRTFELFVVPIDDSSAPLQVNGPCVSGGNVSLGFVVTATGQVVYRADQDVDNVVELYSAPLDGSGASLKLDGPLECGGGMRFGGQFLGVSADGSRVAYVADQDSDEVFELYGVPIDRASEPVRLSGLLAPAALGGQVVQFAATPDGARVVYRADQEQDEVYELYSAPAGGGDAPVKLAGPRVPCGDVGPFRISADSSRVVYVAHEDQEYAFELFSVLVGGGAPPVKISGVSRGVSGDFRLSPDSQHAVFRAYDSVYPNAAHLFSAPIDGSAGPVVLGPASFLGPFEVSPDGARVVFIDRDELFAVPIDGSAGALRLDDGTGPGVSSFEIGPDGARVAYLVWGQVAELYGVPIDGSSAPVKLSAGSVASFRIAPDGARVVYRADMGTTWRLELFSAPLDGSAAPVRLCGTLPAEGDVWEFEFDASGTRVVYRADQEAGGRLRLYSAPLDGSSAPVGLTSTLMSNRDVSGFALSPDGTQAVILADVLTFTRPELYVVPTDGSAGPTRISAPIVSGGRIETFQVAPYGRWVFYRANAETFGNIELYRAALHGSSSVERMNGALVPGGSVLPGVVVPELGGRVLYCADQDFDGVQELYATELLAPSGGQAPSSTPARTVTRRAP